MKGAKKLRFFAVFTFALTLTVSWLSVECVGGTTTDTTDTTKPQGLLAPEISVSDDGLFLSEVEGAKGYEYKLNDGDWVNLSEQREIEFPQTVGNYTLYARAYKKAEEYGAETTKTFFVKTGPCFCQQNGNELQFNGKNIWYSVNNGEFALLNDEKLLDFSACEVGDSYTVSYYTKGGFWSEAETAYYIDGEKQMVSLDVFMKLPAPELQVNVKNKKLVWNKIDLAVGYEVSVDGDTTTLSAETTEYGFPTEVGEHSIHVKALGTGSVRSSDECVYDMTTEAGGVPEITYDIVSGNITWDKKYSGCMLKQTSQTEYDGLDGYSVSYADGLALKLSSVFDQTNHVYKLESLPLKFVKRDTPTVLFDKEGAVSWKNSDTDISMTYYIKWSKDPSFVEINTDELQVADYESGDYSFELYAGEYIFKSVSEATMYLPSDTTALEFYVLKTPYLGGNVDKIVWEEDEKAISYEYKIANGSWNTASGHEVGINGVTECTVRAIGCDEPGNYVVTSKQATITVDPAKYQLDFSKCSEVAEDLIYYPDATIDETEHALLMRNKYNTGVNIGYSNGLKLLKNTLIEIEYKIANYPNTCTGSEVHINAVAGKASTNNGILIGTTSIKDEYVKVSYYTTENTELSSVAIFAWGADGNTYTDFYIRSIQCATFDEPDYTDLSFDQFETVPAGLKFSPSASIDTTEGALHGQNKYNTGFVVGYASPITVKAGTKLTVVFKIENFPATCTGAEVHINATAGQSATGNGTSVYAGSGCKNNYYTLEYLFKEETEFSSVAIFAWGADNATYTDYYIRSIQCTEYDEPDYTDLSFDQFETVPVGLQCSPSASIDTTEGILCGQNQYNTGFVVGYPSLITIEAGTKLTMVFKIENFPATCTGAEVHINATAGQSATGNGTSVYAGSGCKDNYYTLEYEFESATELNSIAIFAWGADSATVIKYCIKSIVIK